MAVKSKPVVLRRFKSKGGPGYHAVRLSKKGQVYCTCPGWVFHGWCRHLEECKKLFRGRRLRFLDRREAVAARKVK